MVKINRPYRCPDDPVVDYQQLMAGLTEYAKPRDRIGRLMERGDVIRVRKGLYVWGQRAEEGRIVRGRLANLIYGPSYVSLDSALSYHGWIPEQVEEMTSVTCGKSRLFETPFGRFSYRPLPVERYAPGVTLVGEGAERFLLATPEKALADKVWCDKRFKPSRQTDYQEYLLDDLRIDAESLAAADVNRLERIADAFNSARIRGLLRFVKTLHTEAV